MRAPLAALVFACAAGALVFTACAAPASVSTPPTDVISVETVTDATGARSAAGAPDCTGSTDGPSIYTLGPPETTFRRPKAICVARLRR